MDMAAEAETPDTKQKARQDGWFRNEVRKALADVDRADRIFVGHDEVLRIARSRFGFKMAE